MSTFRDELADEIAGQAVGSGYYALTVHFAEAREQVDALLASEPMQAIRRTLLQHAEEAATEYNDRWAGYRSTTVRRELADLPESVIDWVMEGNE